MDVYKTCTENDYVPMPNPASPLTMEEVDEVSVMSSTLVDYVNSSLEGFISGTMPLENWDTFVKECESKGSKQLEELYNEAWARK